MLGRVSGDSVDYESSCDVAQPKKIASSRTRRVVAVWEIAVDERDRHSQREEKTTPEDNPPSVKRMCRVSLVASAMLLLHGLRCSGATRPRRK